MNKIFLILILLLSNSSIASESDDNQSKQPYSKYDVINHPKDARSVTNMVLYYDQRNDFLTKEHFDVLQEVTFEVLDDFKGKESCYISCLSDASLAVINSKRYGNIVGFIKVKGVDDKQYCNPYDVMHDDYNLNRNMTQICNEYISLCDGNKCSVNAKTAKIFQGSKE